MTRANTLPTAGRVPSRTWAFNPLTHSRRAVLAFLQGLFAQLSPDRRWTDDLKTTAVVIGDARPVQTAVVGTRPAITVVRAPMGWGGLFLDDLQAEGQPVGGRTHSDLLSSNLIINCLATSDVVSEDMAWFCSQHLWILRRMLLSAGFFEIGRKQVIGSTTPAGALVAGDVKKVWVKTSITLPFHLQYTSAIVDKADVLASIAFHMQATVGAPIDLTSVLAGIVDGAVVGWREQALRPIRRPAVRPTTVEAPLEQVVIV